MKITSRDFFLAQQQCLLLAIHGRCSSEELADFSARVELFANAPKPEYPAMGKAQDLSGLRICTDMLQILQRYFSVR